MKRLIHILIPVLVAVLVVVALRWLVIDVFTVTSPRQAPALVKGDRVLLNRCAYGLRIPWRPLSPRLAPKAVSPGDWVIFHAPSKPASTLRPDTLPHSAAKVIALPGDTVWMGRKGRVSPYRNYRRGCIWPLVVPARGTHVHMNLWNQHLYALTINAYEGHRASVVDDTLRIDGEKASIYRFEKDYYWVFSGQDRNLHDSRTMGFIPDEYLVGRISAVLYSLAPDSVWYRSWRKERFFMPIGGKP